MPTRAVKDEIDLAGYCLNCIKKHSAMAHGLLVEVESRLMQGSPVTDMKVKEKMASVMEQMVHIEDHSIVKKSIDDETRQILMEISNRANDIRGIIKDQGWALEVKNHIPKGEISDISDMRLRLRELQKFNDHTIVNYGCGDCLVENLSKKLNVVKKTSQPLTMQTHNPIDDTFNSSNSIDRNRIGDNMVSWAFLNNFNSQPVDDLSDNLRTIAGLNGAELNQILVPQALGALSEHLFDIIISPGLGPLAQVLGGLAIAAIGGLRAPDSRARTEMVTYGISLATRILRMTPGEITAMFNNLGALGQASLQDPTAIRSVFRTPAQIQSGIQQRIPTMSGFNLSGFLGNSSKGSLPAGQAVLAQESYQPYEFREF